MYKIIKVADHYEIKNVNGNLLTDVYLSGLNKAEVRGLIRMIAEDIGVSKDIYNSAIVDCINKLKDEKKI